MYKLSTLLFNIKNKQPNFKNEKTFTYYFPNFDSINYFFSIAKNDDVEKIDLNYIIKYGILKYKPKKEKLLILFKYIIYFNHINKDVLDSIWNQLDNYKNLKYNYYNTELPSINKYAYELIFKNNENYKQSNLDTNIKNVKNVFYNTKEKDYSKEIKLSFIKNNIYPDSSFFNFIRNKKDIYIEFKNFDNEFVFMDSLADYQFLDNELQYFSSKNNVIPFASENLYSLCYGIDPNDNQTKIFIGETDDFDERNEIIANNFDELFNSEESLLKVYNFMKSDSLATEF